MRVISTVVSLVAGTPVNLTVVEPFARDFGINYADCPEYFINGAEWPLAWVFQILGRLKIDFLKNF